MQYNRGPNWVKMAYNLKVIDKNKEYIEKENEFDINKSHNLTNMEMQNLTNKKLEMIKLKEN